MRERAVSRLERLYLSFGLRKFFCKSVSNWLRCGTSLQKRFLAAHHRKRMTGGGPSLYPGWTHVWSSPTRSLRGHMWELWQLGGKGTRLQVLPALGCVQVFPEHHGLGTRFPNLPTPNPPKTNCHSSFSPLLPKATSPSQKGLWPLFSHGIGDIAPSWNFPQD